MSRRVLCAVLSAYLLGCGVGEEEFESVQASSNEQALSASSRSFVALRRDVRRCAAPQCGGYFVRDVNRKWLKEAYVSALDFTNSGLSAEVQAQAVAAPDGELLVFGRLGPVDAISQTRPFLVSQAFRGLPGVKVTRSDRFHRVDSKAAVVRCVAPPCMSETAHHLNSTATQVFSSYSFSRALKPAVDEVWLRHRVMEGQALVAGFVRNGAQMAAGRDRVLDVRQVFLLLPESQRVQCPHPMPAPCPDGLEHAWERSADRCLYPVGCVAPGACAQGFPVCEAGYTLKSWAEAPSACRAYACDPDFSL